MITHVAKPLDDEALSLQPSREPRCGQILRVPEDLPQGVLNPSSRGLDATRDPPLSDGLAGHARDRIEVFRM